MKSYLVQVKLMHNGFEKYINSIVAAPSELWANTVAIGEHCRSMTDENEDEVLKFIKNSLSKSGKGQVDIDLGFIYAIKKCIPLQTVTTDLDGRPVDLYISSKPNVLNQSSKMPEDIGELRPFLIKLKWFVEELEKDIKDIYWAETPEAAFKQALLAECHDYDDEEPDNEDAVRLMEEIEASGGREVEDSTGGYRSASAEELSLITFDVGGVNHSGLVRLSDTFANRPAYVYMCSY
ncbi:MAG: hypothetical protein VYA60_05150 [Pseudomonadota bacterium]|nr:hypothetical protein [Pseudomonadota bacterium]